MSMEIKISKAPLSKIIQSGGFLDAFRQVCWSIDESCCSFRLKTFWYHLLQWHQSQGVIRAGKGITLVIWNEDVDGIIRIVKLLENLNALTDGVSETVKLRIKEQEGGFLGMLLGTLGASMFGNMLTGKGLIIWIICIKTFSLYRPVKQCGD